MFGWVSKVEKQVPEDLLATRGSIPRPARWASPPNWDGSCYRSVE